MGDEILAAFRQSMDVMDLPLGLLASGGEVLHVNRALAELLRRDDQSEPSRLDELIAEDDAKEFLRRAESRNTAPFAACTAAAGGGLVMLRLLPLWERDFRVFTAWTQGSDMLQPATGRSRTRLEYEAIMANAPVAIGFSLNRRIVRYNAKFAEMFGFVGDAGLGQPTLTLYPSAEAMEAVSRRASPLLSSGKPFDEEMEMRRQDNSLFWAHAIAYLVDPADPPQGTIWIISDITERRVAAEVQRQITLDLQAIVDNAAIGILFSRNRTIERCNRHAEAMLGYAPGGLAGSPAIDIYPSPESYERIGKEAGPLLAAGESFLAEWEFRKRDGGLIWFRVYARALDPEHTDRGTVWITEDITQAKAIRDELQKTVRELEALLTNASVGILFTRDRVMQRYNPRFAEMFGFTATSGVGLSGGVLFPSDSAYDELGRLATPLLSQAKPFHHECAMHRQDGTDFWASLIGYVADPDSPAQGTIWIIDDRSAFKAAEVALKNVSAEQQLVLDNSVVGIVFFKERVIQRCNRRFEELYGYAAGAVLGQSMRDMYVSAADWDRIGVVAYEAMGRGESFCEELLHRRHDGTTFWARVTGKAIDSMDPHAGSIWNIEDVTERHLAEDALRRSHEELEDRVRERTRELKQEIVERRRAEERLRHLALHDPLTGLPNRNLLRRRLEDAVHAANLGEAGAAIMFIDLDRFKNINDSLGHHVGDILLKKVATRLQEILRSDDTVARVGGDEFVVVLPAVESPRRAAYIALKIIDILRPVFCIERHELYVTPSIGICLAPRDGADADLLMRNADTAMYQAKNAGRNTYRFFEAGMNAAAEQYFQIESSLRRALDRDEIEPYYQPIVALDGRLAALEVLVRWRHPTLGLLTPAHFIAVAEESGLIVPLGRLVFTSACLQYREWRDRGLAPPPLAVNLSPIQFRDASLVADIVKTLSSTGVAPDAIELEITETALMEDGEQTLATLRRLADIGLRLSIDDFGTGYSSLAYLKRFPVNKLKVDRSFIKDMAQDENDRAIVRTVLALAASMRLTVVAEGVELAEQENLLREMGCDFAQGYLYSRPVPAAEIEAVYFGPGTGGLRAIG